MNVERVEALRAEMLAKQEVLRQILSNQRQAQYVTFTVATPKLHHYDELNYAIRVPDLTFTLLRRPTEEEATSIKEYFDTEKAEAEAQIGALQYQIFRALDGKDEE